MHSADKIKGVSLALTGAVMWGIMGIFVRNLNALGYSSTDTSFIRCFLAGIVFFIIIAITNPKLLKMGFLPMQLVLPSIAYL